jgi:ATPase subunit of ABC transporter with duplicated ATPase domains
MNASFLFVLLVTFISSCDSFVTNFLASHFRKYVSNNNNNKNQHPLIESSSYSTTTQQQRLLFSTLFAKKKSKTLISDDFLASFAEDIAEDATVESTTTIDENAVVDQKQNKKKKKKKGTDNNNNDDDLSSKESDKTSTVSNGEADVIGAPSVGLDSSIIGGISPIDETSSSLDSTVETVEQRARRERPPSRVRFAESSQPGFVMMGLEQISLAFGNVEVLVNISFSVSTGERVGLVGPNGSGKTTQLRILAGDLQPTSGTIVKSSQNLRVSFLRQEFLDSLNPENTLKDELFSTFKEEQQILDAIAQCENDVAQSVGNEDQLTQILDKLQSLQEKAISKGVYSMNSKVEKIMGSMGFSSNDADAKIKTFSGGWKMRIGLAKILLEGPNIVLLDEPTNHLDLDSVFWLEDFLKKQSIPMVIVSHDREFLDRVCNKIVDTEDGHSVSYDGNYSRFLELRRQRLEIWKDQYEKQLKYIKEEEKVIKKAKGDPSQSHVVTSKEAALEKLRNSDEWIRQPPKDKKFRFRFPPAPRCGQSMVEVNKLCHGYSANSTKVTLFKDVNIQVDRGDRIGFVGPNGVGVYVNNSFIIIL